MMEIRLKGAADLDRFLAQFPVTLQRKVLRKALLRGANVVRDDARQRVTKKSGRLAKSIKTKDDTINGVPMAKVYLRGKHAYLGRWIEYGVSAHAIAAGTRQDGTKGALKLGGDIFADNIEHPGFAPMPFLRPAFDARQKDAINAIGAYVAEYMKFGAVQAPKLEVSE